MPLSIFRFHIPEFIRRSRSIQTTHDPKTAQREAHETPVSSSKPSSFHSADVSAKEKSSYPQELVDCIIDACKGDIETLHSFALVSRSCLTSARRHLYYTVLVNEHHSHLITAPTLFFLDDFIDRYPSVCHFIRRLFITYSRLDLSALVSTLRKLPRLLEVDLVINSVDRELDPPDPPPPQPFLTTLGWRPFSARIRSKRAPRREAPSGPTTPLPHPPPHPIKVQTLSITLQLQLRRNLTPCEPILRFIEAFSSISHLNLKHAFSPAMFTLDFPTPELLEMDKPHTQVRSICCTHEYTHLPRSFVSHIFEVIDVEKVESLDISPQESAALLTPLASTLTKLCCRVHYPLASDEVNGTIFDLSSCSKLETLELKVTLGPTTLFQPQRSILDPLSVLARNVWQDTLNAVSTLPTLCPLSRLAIRAEGPGWDSNLYHPSINERTVLGLLQDVDWWVVLERFSSLETVEVHFVRAFRTLASSEPTHEIIRSKLIRPKSRYSLQLTSRAGRSWRSKNLEG